MEAKEESRRKLYASKDFVELTGLGHDLSEGSAEDGAEADTPVEASFRCRSCGDEIRFRDLAWGLAPQPLWVLSEITGGDPREDCRARRVRRLAQKRLVQMKLLDRWKRLRWAAANRGHLHQ